MPEPTIPATDAATRPDEGLVCVHCDRPVADVCPACEVCQACCDCARCPTCQGPTQTPVCVACGQCPDCCDCRRCDNCGDLRDPDDFCGRCEDCTDCCPCEVCPHCDDRVESVCSGCAHCEDCCDCAHCACCSDPCEGTCGECDRCEDCCDCWYCEGCDESHRRSVDDCPDCAHCLETCDCEQTIYPYETDVMQHLDFQGTPDSGLYLGVELEVQVKTARDEKAEAWTAAAAGFALLKHDGSIGYGFEIVTAPADLTTHRTQWSRLLGDRDLTRDLRSWDAQDTACGMHVHVSRAPISPLTLGKLLVFMNSPQTSAAVRVLAGRDSARWAARCQKKLTDGARKCARCAHIRTQKSNYCRHCAQTTSSHSGDGTRYQAVNLCNSDTIEFRIFRGTLNRQHVLANIEFCDAVVRWCMQNSIAECEDWGAFWTYVLAHRKTYPNLMGYTDRTVGGAERAEDAACH